MGGVGSGGPNGGPQYSPMNVSANGGNGQSGTQGATYIPGLPQGQGEATYRMQSQAPMAGPATPPPAPTLNLPPVPGIASPTARPQEDIMHGSPIGPGANQVANLPNPVEAQYQTAKDVIQGLGSSEDASPMMKYLAQRIGNRF